MIKRLIITSAVFVVIAAAIVGVGALSNPQAAALPQAITKDSTCPVAGCFQTDGACHASAVYPKPDSNVVMICPRVEGCADSQCHAFDRITQAGKPLDASLNLWVIVPTLLVLGLVGVARKLT